MPLWMYRTISDSLPGFLVALWTLYTHGEKPNDGCGHAVLGPDSGVLSSKNYPGTYPNNTWCEWRLEVPAGSWLLLKFGDLDIEAQDCQSSYVRILKRAYGAEHVYGRFCGSVRSYSRELHTDSNQLIVEFHSGNHISGRGFLLSYSTTDHRDLLTCLDKGSYFSAPKYRKYCPAGCRGVAGEVSGDVYQGYRHTSVLCKAAVHAGVIQDEKGGWVSVETHKGLSHYPASRANGVQSKHGSLSDSLFTFISNECQNQSVLRPVAITASSWWHKGVKTRPPNNSICIQDQVQVLVEPRASTPTWVAEQSGSMQWLQLDLGEKKRITGIVTAGSTWLQMDYYVRSYRIEVKEKSRWRAYTPINSTGYKVLEGNQDCIQQSRTSLHPPIVARFLRLIPLSWNQGIAMAIQLLGCPHIRVNVSSQLTETPPTQPRPMVNQGITQPVASYDDLVKLVIIIVPTVLSLLLLLTGICVFKMLHKKRTKDQPYGSSEEKTGCWKQMKQPFARHQSTEFTISYSSEKDPMHKLDFTSTMTESQQPLMIGMGTVSRKGSTFRPMDTDTKDDATDLATHYDYLHTTNQYALPLTNQEPEYATPIIERHTFRKDNFLPDLGNYSVPGAVLSRVSEGACKNPGVGLPGDYQTPHVKHPDRVGLDVGYDCPKASQSHSKAQRRSDYQQPQAKSVVLGGYSTPRDCSLSPFSSPEDR